MIGAPLPFNEDERLQALHSYNILDTLQEADFDALVKLASEICGTPVALISLVDKDRQWFKAKVGVEVDETPRSQSFCAYALLNPVEPLIVTDARNDKRFANNPLVTGDPHIVFYAGVPLVTPDGSALGSLCVIDSKEHQLTPGQLESLNILSKQVMAQLELRRKIQELEIANISLLESNVLIQKFARTAAHDIKNPLTNIMLTSQLLERLVSTEKNRELAGKNIQACKQLLELVNSMLSYARSSVLSEYQEIDLHQLVKKVTSLMDVPDNVVIELPVGHCKFHSSAVAMEQIFLNLLSNAVRYNDKPLITIRIQCREMVDYYELKISDNGIGIQPEHLDRIFEDSFTSGLPDRFQQQGTGIGLYTVRALIEKLQGNIYAESVPGEKTVFHLQLPKLKNI